MTLRELEPGRLSRAAAREIAQGLEKVDGIETATILPPGSLLGDSWVLVRGALGDCWRVEDQEDADRLRKAIEDGQI